MTIRNQALWACLLMASTSYATSTYKVRSGDSLETIAKKVGVSAKALQTANPGIKPTRLQIGDTLRIPSTTSRRSSGASRPSNSAVARSGGRHVVSSGDRDETIARRHGLTVAQLHRLNPGVKWTRLQIGQRLNVSAARPAVATRQPSRPAPQSASSRTVSRVKTATVRSGDTADRIARRVGLTGEQLRRLNPGVKWTRLQPGQTLKVGTVQVAQRPVTRPSARPAVRTASRPAVRPAARPVANVASASAPRRYLAVRGSAVILRQTPSSSGKRVAKLSSGTTGRQLEQRNGWTKLAFASGRTGWVRNDLVASSTAEAYRAPRVVAQRAPVTVASRTSGAVISSAKTFLGVRYRLGGTSRSGFDCSGFVSYVMRRHGVRLPRTSLQQSRAGTAITRSQLRSGDLVFFRTNRGTRINHVGIFIGGGKFIHASSGSGRVRIDTINSGYYRQRFATARRVLRGQTVAQSLRPLADVVEKHGEVALDPEPTMPEATPEPVQGTDVPSE